MTLGYRTSYRDGDDLERKLVELFKLLAHENTLWALHKRQRGVRLPRSAEDAGILYCPDEASDAIVPKDAETLLDAGIGSCGGIAALDVGLMRSRAVFDHRVPLPVATGRCTVKLIRRPGNKAVDYWHAVMKTPDGLVDPTARLRKVCATPRYG